VTLKAHLTSNSDFPISHVALLCITGYLPSFWIKLRLLAIPAVNSGALAALIPPLLGGPTHLTVGLIAAFVAVACIIAADTGAYFCGKSFGRTQVRCFTAHISLQSDV
jgi:phosphatidate cytidylyltransferase